VADLLAGVIEATEEEKEYIFPPGVMDRLAEEGRIILSGPISSVEAEGAARERLRRG